MSGRNSDERLFSEDVERLLRGEESLPAGADSDYDETLRFARRLLALREEPRPEFASSLRQRLLSGMAEQDLATQQQDTQSWLARIFGQPGLRLAMVSTFVVLAAVGLLWKAGLFSALPGQPGGGSPATLQESDGIPPAAPEADSPQMLMNAGDTAETASASPTAGPAATPFVVSGRVAPSNAYGDAIAISLTFANSGPEGMMLSPFPPEVSIRDVSNGQTVYSFAPGTSQLALSSMESTTYDIAWDQKDANGAQVFPGTYAVDVWTVQSRLEKGYAGESPATPAVVMFDVLPETGASTPRETETPTS